MSRWLVDPLSEASLLFLILIYEPRLLNYTPPAVVIRLLTTNGLIAYITSWVLYLSGASSDPRLLLPAWISITTVRSYISNSIPYTSIYSSRRNTVPNIRLPRNPKPRHYKTRNNSLPTSRLSSKFPKHVLTPHAAPSNSRKRTRGPCFRYHAQIMGLGRCYLPAYAYCG
jgi:hypothetical protein